MKMLVNNQTKIADDGKLTITLYSTTKLARITPTWGIEAGALNRGSMLEILMYFTLVLNFMSPKWTRT